jgi:hypothetical protein
VEVKDGTAIDIAYQGTRTPVTGRVLGTGGAPVAGARVTLRSKGTIPKVARVTVGGVASDADGVLDLSVTSAQDGSLPALSLPEGAWEAIVEPPAGTSDGITALPVKVAPGESWKLQLQPRVRLKGVVRDQDGTPIAGVRVVAVARGGPGTSAEATTDAAGAWSIQVDPGLPVRLSFEPGEGRALLRSEQEHDPAMGSPGDVVLEKGIRYGGVVRPPSGSPLVRARVEAWCTTTCGTSGPAAVATTDAEGSFALHLPDPGK